MGLLFQDEYDQDCQEAHDRNEAPPTCGPSHKISVGYPGLVVAPNLIEAILGIFKEKNMASLKPGKSFHSKQCFCLDEDSSQKVRALLLERKSFETFKTDLLKEYRKLNPTNTDASPPRATPGR